MSNYELSERQRAALDKGVAKLVAAAEQAGLNAQDLIDLLNGGMTTLQIVDYIDTQAAGQLAN